MAVGKRNSTSDPLNEHDVAERLDKAAFRTLRILMDVRQIPGAMDAVKHSRYLTNVLQLLADELSEWSVEASGQALDPKAVEALAASTDVEAIDQ